MYRSELNIYYKSQKRRSERRLMVIAIFLAMVWLWCYFNFDAGLSTLYTNEFAELYAATCLMAIILIIFVHSVYFFSKVDSNLAITLITLMGAIISTAANTSSLNIGQFFSSLFVQLSSRAEPITSIFFYITLCAGLVIVLIAQPEPNPASECDEE